MQDILNIPTSTGEQMDTNKKTREYISAFADGELPDADLELALACLREADGQSAWALYHRIGDVLRDAPGESALSPEFAARLAGRLDAESAPVRRAAGRTGVKSAALASIAPGVAVNKGKLAVQPVTPLDGPEAGPASIKRL
jgi:sigma-E factor negative regulatory protein RseA